MKKLTPIPAEVKAEAASILKRVFDIDAPEAKCYYGSASPFTFFNATHYEVFHPRKPGSRHRSIILLHGKFRNRAKTFFYSRAEILAHELVHACRVQYGPVWFEEYLAYQTSSSRFHRFFGSCFRSPLALLLFPIELLRLRRLRSADLKTLIKAGNGGQTEC